MPEDTSTTSSSSKVLSIGMVLNTVRQGDVISLGAVNLVGVGASDVWTSTATHEGLDPETEPSEGIWSLTIESDAGWYVIITQDCDIVRMPETEPCLVVCPVKFVSPEHWGNLRYGPGSPREFPLPDHPRIQREGKKAIADLRFVTSVDKEAVLHKSVEIIHPLTAPQRARFARWAGARYARVPHSDELETRVLPKAAKTIQDAAKKFAKGDTSNPITRLVGSVDQWYLAGNDKMIEFIGVTSDSSLNRGKFWKDGQADMAALDAAKKALANKLSAGLPADAGYVCKLEITTLHSISAAMFLAWSEWIIEKNQDPLAT